ncbi:MAG TPA: alpha/beta hydrolase [Acidobacteriota bacterium]|nr:alpha/beta hydrolase [Acidobacteriota bacterium]
MSTELKQGMVPTPDGTQLCAYRIGTGPQAVIIPNAIYLLEHFAYLGRDLTVVSYDLRNRGRSTPVHDRALLHRGIHHDVDDLETVRQFFELERPHLVGHSYLGLAVILYAITNPKNCGRIVQIGPPSPDHGAVYPPELTAPDLEAIASSESARQLQRLRNDGMVASDPKEFCRHWWEFMRRVYVAIPGAEVALGDHYCEFENEWPLNMEAHLSQNILPSIARLALRQEDIDQVEVPVLTIHGRRDRNAPYGAGRDWAARLSDARLLTIEEAAHFPFLERPDVVGPAVRQFLDGVWPTAATLIEPSTTPNPEDQP